MCAGTQKRRRKQNREKEFTKPREEMFPLPAMMLLDPYSRGVSPSHTPAMELLDPSSRGVSPSHSPAMELLDPYSRGVSPSRHIETQISELIQNLKGSFITYRYWRVDWNKTIYSTHHYSLTLEISLEPHIKLFIFGIKIYFHLYHF